MKKIIMLLLLVTIGFSFVGCAVFDMYDGEPYQLIRQYAFDNKECYETLRITIVSDKREIFSYYSDGDLVRDMILYTESGNYADWYTEYIYY